MSALHCSGQKTVPRCPLSAPRHSSTPKSSHTRLIRHTTAYHSRQCRRFDTALTASATDTDGTAAVLDSPTPKAEAQPTSASPAVDAAHSSDPALVSPQPHIPQPATSEAAEEGAGATDSTGSAASRPDKPSFKKTFSKGKQGGRGDGRYKRRAEKTPELVPPGEADWLKQYAVVAGEVVHVMPGNGARIQLVQEPRIQGWIQQLEGPSCFRPGVADSWRRPTEQESVVMKVGTIRDFLVLKVPEDLSYNGRGPLLSARQLDQPVIWTRLEQLAEAYEPIKSKIIGTCKTGVFVDVLGMSAFVPAPELGSMKPKEFVQQEDLEPLVGQECTVVVIRCERETKKMMASCKRAESLKVEGSLKQGELVWGTVWKIEPYGAFISLDDMDQSGLLHVSQVSRFRVDDLQDFFEKGERVRALVVDVQSNDSGRLGQLRISLSTQDIEAQDGDMLNDRQKVYEEADAIAEEYRIWLKEQGQGGNEDVNYSRNNGGSSNGAGHGGGGGANRELDW